jgi:hypothetical protein
LGFDRHRWLQQSSGEASNTGVTCRAFVTGTVLILALLLPAPTVGVPTAAIAARTPLRIVLAADSKENFVDNRSGTECKIFGYGSLFFALSGIPYDRQRGYDVATIVRKGFSQSGSFQQRVTITKGLLRRGLLHELRLLKREDPRVFEWALGNGEVPLQLALAQVENGVPLLAILEFKFDARSASLSAIMHACPGDCGGESHAYYLGEHGAIDALLKKKPIVDVQDLPMLMQLELNDRPNDVGGPINILEVTTAGPRWVLGGNLCRIQ